MVDEAVSIIAIGRAVRAARERSQQSLTELAGSASVAPEVVAALEDGRSGITRAQLAAVARALALEPEALAQGREVARPRPSVFLRHRGLQDFHDADLDVLDEALDQGMALRELGERLNRATTPWNPSRRDAPHDKKDAAAHDGYQLADALRRYLDEPTRAFTDLRAHAEQRLAVAVLVRPLSTRGACAVSSRDAAAIVLDESDHGQHPVWAQSAVAHELCHIFCDPRSEGIQVVLDADADRNPHANEQRARAFAAELLLPRKGLQKLLGLPSAVRESGAAVELVKHAMDHYRTTWELTANHLCNLRFVDKGLRVWLEAAHAHPAPSLASLRLPPAGAASLEVTACTQAAHEAGWVTDGEARRLLGIGALADLPWIDSRPWR